MKIINCGQGTEEWFNAKLGVPSSSNFDKIITTTGQPSKQAEQYMYKLAGETITKHSENIYQNEYMVRGQELESEARALYELQSDLNVKQVGFCLLNDYGCSPDGLVGLDGLLEIKCPKISTHVSYLVDNVLPKKYFQQVQGQLLVTGRKWCDFMSYYPAIKPFIIRVRPDKEFQTKLKKELKVFCNKLKKTIEKIK